MEQVGGERGKHGVHLLQAGGGAGDDCVLEVAHRHPHNGHIAVRLQGLHGRLLLCQQVHELAEGGKRHALRRGGGGGGGLLRRGRCLGVRARVALAALLLLLLLLLGRCGWCRE